jgi:hypothetical protein
MHIAARFSESVQMNWLIWSLEHRGWRKPADWGFTTATNRAGFFTDVEAKQIVDRANSAVKPGEFLKEIMVPAPAKDNVRTDFKKENTLWSGALAGEICHCGEPAEHMLEEMVPLDDRNPYRAPLKAFLCSSHFREIMGPAAWL